MTDERRAPARPECPRVALFVTCLVDLFRPSAAALLNVAADHLDRYDSLDHYRRAKLNIFRRQKPGDVAILNADDPSVVAAAPDLCWRAS